MPDPLIAFPELKQAIFDDDQFDLLVTIWGIDEVRIALAGLAQDILRQLTDNPDADTGWRKRAGFLKVQVDGRLRVVKQQIIDRNREENTSSQALNTKWGTFALNLARELYLLDPQTLTRIDGPGDSDENAAEWLHKRLAKQARKAN